MIERMSGVDAESARKVSCDTGTSQERLLAAEGGATGARKLRARSRDHIGFIRSNLEVRAPDRSDRKRRVGASTPCVARSRSLAIRERRLSWTKTFDSNAKPGSAPPTSATDFGSSRRTIDLALPR